MNTWRTLTPEGGFFAIIVKSDDVEEKKPQEKRGNVNAHINVCKCSALDTCPNVTARCTRIMDESVSFELERGLL